MAEFFDIVKCLFTNRKDYKNISDEDKELNFFIINRYMSKKYPELAQKLNNKQIDKSVALDLWFINDKVKNESYPGWFWSKSNSKKDKPIIPNPDKKLLMKHFDINDQDMDTLIKYFLPDVKEELSYVKSLEKEHGKL